MRFFLFAFLIYHGSLIFSYAGTLSFIALKNDKWVITVCTKNGCETIKTKREPRTYDIDFKTNSIVYVGSDGLIYFIDSNRKETLLFQPTQDGYTQPRFIKKNKIAFVKLINKNSKKTQIVLFNTTSKKIETVLLSRNSTVLDPYFSSNSLYYANVECTVGCGKIIQEIWVQKPLRGPSKQLTMLGTISHQPAYDKQKKTLYFSSLTDDGYKIFFLTHNQCHPKRVTKFQNGSEAWPAIDRKGRLYFVFTYNGSSSIFYLENSNSKPKSVQLPINVSKIRNLKVAS